MTSPRPSLPSLTVASSVLAAVAKWTSPDHTRLHLRLVVFRDDELIATDGHRLARVPCPTHGLTIGVDRAHVLAAIAAQAELEHERGSTIEIAPDGARHVQLRLVRPPFGEVVMTVPSGNVSDYPPIDPAMPTPGGSGCPEGYLMDPRYLAAIHEITAAMHPDAHHGVTLTAWCPAEKNGDRLGPMMFTNAGGARFVIMPMRAP